MYILEMEASLIGGQLNLPAYERRQGLKTPMEP